MDNRIFCRRPDLTVFAVYSPKEWFALRNAGTLDADLKRRRESGVIIEVEREPEMLKPAHVPPRANDGMTMHNPTGVDARMVLRDELRESTLRRAGIVRGDLTV